MAYKKWLIGAVLLFVSVYLRETISVRLSVSTLDDDQKMILKAFRAAMMDDLPQDYMKEEAFLLRWLIPVDFSGPAAITNLQKHLIWRKNEKVDDVHEEDWSDYKKRFPFQLTVNKEGRPVVYYHFGDWDITEFLESKDFSRLTRYVAVLILEEAEKRVTQLRKESNDDDINQFDIIIDLGRYDSEKNSLAAVQFYIDVARSSEDHYTGAVEHVYIINAPTIFEMTYNLISHAFMMERTRNTIQVLGGREIYEPILLEKINEEQMPIIVD